jgi:hypothetical protein
MGSSRCAQYIRDGSVANIPEPTNEEVKMFGNMNKYRRDNGWTEWKWSGELYRACWAMGKFIAENPTRERDWDVDLYDGLADFFKYYGYHLPGGSASAQVTSAATLNKLGADEVWDMTVTSKKFGLVQALNPLSGYLDAAVALVGKTWVFASAMGNVCVEETVPQGPVNTNPVVTGSVDRPEETETGGNGVPSNPNPPVETGGGGAVTGTHSSTQTGGGVTGVHSSTQTGGGVTGVHSSSTPSGFLGFTTEQQQWINSLPPENNLPCISDTEQRTKACAELRRRLELRLQQMKCYSVITPKTDETPGSAVCCGTTSQVVPRSGCF